MLIEVLQTKLHNATLTDANLYYKGSITIGDELLEKSGLRTGQKVQVVNINNGSRLETYVIKGKGREVCLNGAAARLGHYGDKVIVIAYCTIDDKEYDEFTCKGIFLDGEKNENLEEKSWKLSELS